MSFYYKLFENNTLLFAMGKVVGLPKSASKKLQPLFGMKVLIGTVLILTLVSATLVPKSTVQAANSADFLSAEGPPPPGANDPNCHLDEEHPYPVVLVPGTFETMQQNWAALSPLLAAKGYCVYSLNYGFSSAGPSTGSIQDSALELKTFVENVLKLTGAKKVSIVGHSQGGMMPRYYIKFLGGANKVDDLIGLVPSNHGTKGLAGLKETFKITHLLSCTACDQQQAGSDFL
ncbi:esterase/lipase family protein [Polycladomyces subterraneus]|uniref:Lipase family protein n=1 Tax=Polycladomyces subterraneus TaxID=1016997 RepID=A0ABT8IKB3_9BACL|nr:alpha/beta fold hydrolase [Polycladomyces subterraneus]MDN4592832.1 lipase family protein [Polycladomyces subterraneus]